MRLNLKRVIVSEFVTLDGIMEDPGGAEKFRYGGWTVSYWSEEMESTSSMNYFLATLYYSGE